VTEIKRRQDILRSTPAWFCLAVGLGAAGCHGDETKEAQTPDGPEVISFDVSDDSAAGTGLPADFGRPCAENTDCLSGYCVVAPDGFACSTHCVESCPSGWQCRGIAAGSSDLAFVCVPGEATDADVIDGPDDVLVGGDGQPQSDTAIARDTVETDVGPNPTPDLCGLALGGAGENVLSERPGDDFGDCVVGCDRAASDLGISLNLTTDAYTAVLGRIDANSHVYDGVPGPDTDVVSVLAPVRTVLEFAIQRSATMSMVDPLVYVTDGFVIRTFNRNDLNHNDCARTTIAFPWLQDLPIYVVVEDTNNADAWAEGGQVPASWVGGDSYGWLMRVRATPFAPIELGRLGGPLNLSGETFATTGVTRYYRFTASGLADFTVRIAEEGNTHPEFVLFAGGIKTMLGALEWHRMADDGGNRGFVSLDRSAFRPCVPEAECFAGNCNGPKCTADDVEYIFAVGDWEGGGGLGFNYAIEVTPR